MATFSLVHGAWHGGWCWDAVRAELEAGGHAVHTPDLPCEDVAAGVEECAAAVPAADVVVGHSLGGLTIPYVEAGTHVFLAALVGGTGGPDVFVPGFGDGRTRDELGRSYYPDPADAAAELQYPSESAPLASRLRPQAPLDPDPLAVERPVYVVCARDAVIRPEWQRHLARDVLGVEPLELDSGHSPMLERPRELADLLDALV
ncbi:MAG TPA: alpha/beta fold hydrolase [Gaiellaceae bacterium]|nr:alpha/beta fold hydrolase [Gaiellaceae bacterium]